MKTEELVVELRKQGWEEVEFGVWSHKTNGTRLELGKNPKAYIQITYGLEVTKEMLEKSVEGFVHDLFSDLHKAAEAEVYQSSQWR